MPEVAIAAGVSQAKVKQEISAYAEASRTGLEAWCRHHQLVLSDGEDRLDATFATWSHRIGELETEVALAGRVNDLILIDRPDLFDPFTSRVFDAAVFASGRAALIVPTNVPSDLLKHVCIAWNGSLEAARCVGQAISLLHEAQRVTIIEVESSRLDASDAADLERYLRYHGIIAYRRQLVRGNLSVAEQILSVANGLNASMLMMGAYTHSRVREFLLGGVTRYMIGHAQIPLLMAH